MICAALLRRPRHIWSALGDRVSVGRLCCQWAPLRTAGLNKLSNSIGRVAPAGRTETALALRGVQQVGTFGHGSGLHPAGDAELAEDVADVHPGGLGADVQLGTDLGVGAPGCQQPTFTVSDIRRSQRPTRNTSIKSRDAQDPVPILVTGPFRLTASSTRRLG